MPKQVAVIGLGRFGAAMARTLYNGGHDVMAVDRDPAVVRDMKSQVTYPVEGDATDEQFFREVGILNYDVAVVAIGSDIQASLLTTVLLYSMREDEIRKRQRKQTGLGREEDIRPFIIARAQDKLHANALRRIGADKVVQIESEAGEELAHLVSIPYRVRPYVERQISVSAEYSITKMKTPPQAANRTLRDIRLGRPRDKYGLVVIAIRREKDMILNPDEDEELQPDDVLIVGGKAENLDRLTETQVQESVLAEGGR